MERFRLTRSCALVLAQGDLTQLAVDAIVNAANSRMQGGGGVDGAIHRAAGRELLAACRRIPEVRPGVRCPTGEARITPGFRLPARHVIHAVGPWYRSPEVSAPLLRSAYRASLELANAEGLRSIAFPAISCGVYRYPLEEAAPLALSTCRDHAGALAEIHFALFDAATYRVWSGAARELGLDPEP